MKLVEGVGLLSLVGRIVGADGDFHFFSGDFSFSSGDFMFAGGDFLVVAGVGGGH